MKVVSLSKLAGMIGAVLFAPVLAAATIPGANPEAAPVQSIGKASVADQKVAGAWKLVDQHAHVGVAAAQGSNSKWSAWNPAIEVPMAFEAQVLGMRVSVTGNTVSEASSSTESHPKAHLPLPAAGWLFGSALIGFVSLSNRRKV